MIRLSRLKRIILFLNASSFKLAKIGHYKNGIYDVSKPLGIALNWCLELSIYRLIILNRYPLKVSDFKIALALSFIFHLGIDFIFKNDLKFLDQEYKINFGTYSFWIYCFAIFMSVIYTLSYLLS
jgi:hypothetical protein